MSNKADLRVIRTRRSLWEALVNLVSSRRIEEITVGDITRNAMVNRATFYRHYEDKEDLLERGTAEILTELGVRIRTVTDGENWGDFDAARQSLQMVLDHISDHAEFYRIMLGSASGWRVRAGISDVVRELLLLKIGSAGTADRRSVVPDDITIRVVASILLELVTWWIKEGRPVPSNELIEYYLKLTVLGPYRCLGFDTVS